ncbi:hypothetical protein CRM81_21815 [Yersinia kristensenii]|nr:hypothetical protein ykris0001_21790 [Yersinia kristensenii ATCC 33638]EEP93407.1 hypothetical protein ykris0001_35380 [Yersinia kristensenii ATCC 33638]PEH56024.1 hypothetical protein CRM81_21815 [Yersinia kristensenii]
MDYHIYIIHIVKNNSLLVDYLFEDYDDNESALLQLIYGSSDIKIHHWLENILLNEIDVFEIESVSSKTLAQDAVEFWSAYFRSIGISVIETDHICERLVMNKI